MSSDQRTSTRAGRVALTLAALLTATPALLMAWPDSRPLIREGERAADEAAARQAAGARAAGGATPGYIADVRCRTCHGDIWDSYQSVGMARAFGRPDDIEPIEDFNAPPLEHAPSRRVYEMLRRGNDIVFRRYQRDAAGVEINTFEAVVDWILGSGHTSRTYLLQNSNGEIYQLPVVWYTQEGGWGMAPGYDNPRHQGLTRIVRQECMFCHNAYPELEAGADAHYEPDVFPPDLPRGIGCQRCHGPGAAHVAAAGDEAATLRDIRDAVVNPGRLDPARRDDVCNQCHLQPSVVVPGLRHLDRPIFSFRAGQQLHDYLVGLDVVEEGLPASERFEINHHSYRLRQSACYLESGGAVACIDCHDPHAKPPAPERTARVDAACAACHPNASEEHRLLSMPLPETAGAELADCASCHMPRRRTQDVVHTVMTDHRIARGPFPDDLTVPRAEREHVVTDILVPGDAESPDEVPDDLYRAIAAMRFSRSPDAVRAARDIFQRRPDLALRPELAVPVWLAIAEDELAVGAHAAALQALDRVRSFDPSNVQALAWTGVALIASDRTAEALAPLREAIARDPGRSEVRHNLALALLRLRRDAEAAAELERVVVERPQFAGGWYYLGLVRERLSLAGAEEAYRGALSADPTHGRAYASLGRLLVAEGRRDEAERWLRHGLEHALDPAIVRETLESLGS